MNMKTLLIFSALMPLISPVAHADSASFLSRMTAAVGTQDSTNPAREVEGAQGDCKLRVISLNPTGTWAMIDVSLVDRKSNKVFNFRGTSNQLSQTSVSFVGAAATSTFIDSFSGTGETVTQKISITRMPVAGLKGASIAITDGANTFTCNF